jgi:arylsulfate sulfotransferase
MLKTRLIALSLFLLVLICTPAMATVTIVSLRPSVKSPQNIGTSVTWKVTATDSNSNNLTFQFNVAPPESDTFTLVKDFDVGTLKSGTWSSLPFVWTPTGIEGTYTIQVVATDFVSGQSASRTATFHVTPLVSGGNPVVVGTDHPLVALFSAPSCAAGSSMSVTFQPQSGSAPAVSTSSMPCHPPHTMTFEIGGMYPTTAYNMFSQTTTGGTVVNGPTLTFTTGALPAKPPMPTFKTLVGPGANTDTTDWLLLHNMVKFGNDPSYPDCATDLAGNIIWYDNTDNAGSSLTRPLPNALRLTLQGGKAWSTGIQRGQYLREFDLAGNIIHETNVGILQQELVAMGARDAQACTAVPKPAPIGSACIGFFHHDAIQTLPNGQTAAFVDIEKIFPPGTQGDTSGLPVDIVGDMIIVLDANWQPVWYFDTFDHDNGPPQLEINRRALLGETCDTNQQGCPAILLLGPGIAPNALDWLHANSIYYWPQTGDIIWSSRNQDWVMRINYNNGAGNGDILWRMGPDGDFTFNNIGDDPWPWFSHQHEVGIEDNGAGVMSLFDNGDTRIAPPPLGLGSHCGPNDCHSRGMAVNFDQTSMQVTPVISVDLGVYSGADGSAQLLADGNYFFLPAVVFLSPQKVASQNIEIYPTSGTLTGTQVLNLQTTEEYRAWQMPDFYNPPIT